ncbi:MAG: hypothetical protein NT045_02760, partial [Candidatus Aureabacteria bacterium]|nr:hypothetical protein [Candidatus Auribacterota bacterium]
MELLIKYIPITISVISLGLSILTLWLTSFNRGIIKCTRPSFIAIKYDFVGKEHPQAKIFLRTLLFSTGKRGNVIENLFLRVKENNNMEEFSFWGYGDTNLTRGSGLYIGENGVATNHHFNPLNAEKLYIFKKEKYEIELV